MAQGMIFKGIRCGILHIFTVDVNPDFKKEETVKRGVQ